MKILKHCLLFFLFSALIFGADFSYGQAATNLNGRILLQVQDRGQAWYVNPLNSQRYYLGRPDDAFQVMRSLGLGVSNSDLAVFLKQAPSRLAGRILLQVQDKGQAYYVDPVELKLYYLGRPTDAFNLMRSRGLGITNTDLAKIAVAAASPREITTSLHNYSFRYQNKEYNLSLQLDSNLFTAYQNSPKVYTYYANQTPTDVRDAFYGLFFNIKNNDTVLDNMIKQAQALGAQNNWTTDQVMEFLLAWVQQIPYDQAKLVNGSNTIPYYPYETLYLNKGVCSDKTFLAVALLRKLGYGAAILDFPEINHTAAGIACPAQYSVNNSGYCYVETTNYFPFGVIPQTIEGQAQSTGNNFTNLFNSSGLGNMDIKQATSGQSYQRISLIREQVTTLQNRKAELDTGETELNALGDALDAKAIELDTLKAQLTSYYNSGQIAEYNSLVPTYNNLADQYNNDLQIYQTKLAAHNQKVVEFNQLVKDFYQH